jgi:tetratricopeptide (TPR) repeat protein
MFEQLWKKFCSNDISIGTALDAHGVRCRRRDFDIISSQIKAGNTDKAQDVLIEMMLSTPVWDPLTVISASKMIAELFLAMGKFESAVEFAEKGLEWDPANPELLLIICKCTAKYDTDKCHGYFNFLKTCGYNESFFDGFIPPETSKNPKEYSITADSFKVYTTDDVLKLMVYQAASLVRRPLFETIDTLRAHALACIGAGNLNLALVALTLALFRNKDPLYLSGLNPVVIQMKNKWLRCLEQYVLTAIEKDAKTKQFYTAHKFTERLVDRRHAVEDLNSAGNKAGLFFMVMDPAPEISFLACQYLIELGDEKQVRTYISDAVMTELKYKEMYGELRPQLLQRIMKNPGVVPSSVSSQVNPDASLAETASDSDAPVKKIVRKKAVSKIEEEEEDEPKPAKKKPGRKKKVVEE